MTAPTHSTAHTRRLVIIACELTLLSALSACSAEGIGQSDSSIETATLAPLETAGSGSTARLINDGSYSLNDALEVENRDPSQPSVTVSEAINAQLTPELGAAAPSNAPESAPEVTPDITPEVTPDITPDITPEVTPEVTPDITPDITPEVTPDITPEVTPEITPEVMPEVVPDFITDESDVLGGDLEQIFFRSPRTPGFTGQLLDDGTIRVTWDIDPTARGYNVYRQAQYITTVFNTEYIDTDVFDGDFYYEIQAFDYDNNFNYVAKGLTVTVIGSGRSDPDQAPTNAALLEGYALIFEDDFNGSALDTSKWNTQFIWGPELIINQEEQYYVDIANDPVFGFNPFTFDGEVMTINTIQTPASLLSKANNQPYLSGIITSRDALKFTYGYVEARARVSYGRGYWPAFWLLNAYYDAGGDWPEIDIMEFIGSDEDVVYHTYHYYDENHVLRSTKSHPTVGIDFTADFHTFGVEWKPGALVYYVDGRIVHRVNNPQVSSEDMYLIANTAVGGWWAGSPDQTTPFPGKYELDHIRVYQKIGPFDDGIFNDAIEQTPIRQNTGQTSPGHRLPFDPTLFLP